MFIWTQSFSQQQIHYPLDIVSKYWIVQKECDIIDRSPLTLDFKVDSVLPLWLKFFLTNYKPSLS